MDLAFQEVEVDGADGGESFKDRDEWMEHACASSVYEDLGAPEDERGVVLRMVYELHRRISKRYTAARFEGLKMNEQRGGGSRS